MIDEPGQGTVPGSGQAGGEAPGQLTPGNVKGAIYKEPLTCPYCSRTFKDKRGLGPHLRFHNPKSTGGKSDALPSINVIEQVVSKAVQDQLTQLIPELKKGIEDNLSTTLVESIRLLNEKIKTEVSNLAQKAEAELQARFSGGGVIPAAQPGNGMVAAQQNPIMQALFARLLGGGGGDSGGDFMAQAARIGGAIGAMMQPIANIQAQAFSNALKLMDIAQKWPTATVEEKAKAMGDLLSTAAPDTALTAPATAPPVPPAPPSPPSKAPGSLGSEG